MKSELKLWKEYKKYVRKLNEPIMTANAKRMDEYLIQERLNWKRWEENLKWYRYSLPPITMTPPMYPLHKETYEGFLDWQLEHKK